MDTGSDDELAGAGGSDAQQVRAAGRAAAVQPQEEKERK